MKDLYIEASVIVNAKVFTRPAVQCTGSNGDLTVVNPVNLFVLSDSKK